MYDNSDPLDLKPLPVIFRSSVSIPTYRPWSEEGKQSYRTSLSSKTTINKFVLDVRRSLNKTNLFKPFIKRNFTNEVDRYAYIFYYSVKMIYFEMLI
jgi:hypothetical protein